ncbi:copper radical oxidase [Panaeolus papilionaceus]|nr:copper radical oxidase [Panaeolus papilionaceus]
MDTITSKKYRPSRIKLLTLALIAPGVWSRSSTTLMANPQSIHQGEPGKFQIIANTLVSAQQVFLGKLDMLYILDKVENNTAQINGHPVWAQEFRLSDNQQRPMEIYTNTFCAGGNVLGNGTWLNVGGNQAVSYGGEPALVQDGSKGPYKDADGRKSIRMLSPDEDDLEVAWFTSSYQTEQRWYPTLETLPDGSMIILGGCRNGGYVNDKTQTVPTYEFFPPRGPPITSPFLQNTLPANLYPLTWLLPSGNLFIQANWESTLLNPETKFETPLDNIPDAIRTYPASAATVMLPLNPSNNWTATILFCGGSNVQPDQWLAPGFIPPKHQASDSCVRITPDASKSYVRDDPLPQKRSMGNFVLLPDGKILCLNGAGMGTAGYGNNTWAIGHSYGDDPVLTPALYDPEAPLGHRWSTQGFDSSVVARMYHSSALLLPDGSVFTGGSNPNPDYTVGDNIRYPTEFRVERFYPPYYNKRRPEPKGLLSQLSYGGKPFDVQLSSDDLFDDVNNVVNARVVLIRPGFSTHAMNMGQRMLVLASTYTGFPNNTGILHVSQLPPNPAVFAPGPALAFVVVDGVPSIGVQVMIGSGKIGTQPVLPSGSTPPSTIIRNSASGHNTPQSNGTHVYRISSVLCLLFISRFVAILVNKSTSL